MLSTLVPVVAQMNSEFKITKVESNFIPSPNYSGPRYDKRGPKAKDWLEVDVTFDWSPRAKEPMYTDEAMFNYYILLKNKSKEAPEGTLLTGSVTHISIPQGKNMHSVVYISPRTLERFFSGKMPVNAGAAVAAAAVTISNQGAVVAEDRGGFDPLWWTKFQQTPGFVLNKNQTPFAPLQWDYYEAIKVDTAGR